MHNVTAENHFVSRFYLDAFTDMNGKLHAYSLLVPKPHLPAWKSYSPAAVGRFTHLYTRVDAGHESDELERWFKREVEDPAIRAIQAARAGGKIERDEWTSLARFLAMHRLRTPWALHRFLVAANGHIPRTLDETMHELPQRLARRASGLAQDVDKPSEEERLFPFPLVVDTEQTDHGTLRLQARVLSGRALWLHDVHRQLTSTWRVLAHHRWTVLRPAAGYTWFTSDHPVVQANFEDDTNYSLEGGWKSAGTEIFMTLDPWTLLYTRVGARVPARGIELATLATQRIRKMLAENAHRYLYAHTPDAELVQLRPRTVDLALYADQEARVRDFHRLQTQEEWEFLTKPTTRFGA